MEPLSNMESQWNQNDCIQKWAHKWVEQGDRPPFDGFLLMKTPILFTNLAIIFIPIDNLSMILVWSFNLDELLTHGKRLAQTETPYNIK